MADIYVRKGTLADLPSIMQVIDEAKQLLKASGSSQWQDGYPYESTLQADIKNGINYVLIDNGEVAGTASLMFTEEPTYLDIDGAWQNPNEQYSTIHRIAISSKFRGQHLSSYFMSNLITITELNGIQNIRFDTHRLNKAMQAVGKGFNFKYRGIIEVDHPDDPKRLAYELNL
ncbi:GNAT family N-acetyltransferase [Lactobacillus sp. Sy-1]|uniref:GNAT family N-acetyltransferase n=1 Tax=Lactobacillus sp. Sy-1 TaxID=2109645 RepID=UPI001C57B211|nr:GNAT family N-acetyltransferase [Lactobacillus sp. Sy-1]MBW1605037.1 GNAT family N-acetyltransferase [Lactobacillus sp. Sy-1]